MREGQAQSAIENSSDQKIEIAVSIPRQKIRDVKLRRWVSAPSSSSLNHVSRETRRLGDDGIRTFEGH